MTVAEVGRRDFLRAAAWTCAGLLAGVRPLWARPPGALRLGLVLPLPEAAVRGAALGAEEASRTAALLGGAVELLRVPAAEAERAAEGGVTALIGGADDGSARALARLADERGILFLNVGAAADSLRGAECGRNAFHVAASDAMLAAALAERPSGSPADAAVLWHPALERFGAQQLGDRYRARFGTEMDAPAWAGWMAVKVVCEASLRARSAEPRVLRELLRRESTRFDGHKGWPLSFRAWDHQLRQPLYLVHGDRLVGEVPARPAEDASSRDALDRLGTSASASTCPLKREGTP